MLRIGILFVLLSGNYSCKRDNIIIQDCLCMPGAPSMSIYIFNQKDSSNVLSSSEDMDSITLKFPFPNSDLRTYSFMDNWGYKGQRIPYLSCGPLLLYSVRNKIKTTYVFYGSNPIPDTLFIDCKTIPNKKAYGGMDIIPSCITLNGIHAKISLDLEAYIIYK